MVSSYLDGKQLPYDHQPALRSYLKDINVNCNVVGDCNSDLDTVGVWVRGEVKLSRRHSRMRDGVDDKGGGREESSGEEVEGERERGAF